MGSHWRPSSFSWFEFLIEKWQTRRRTINISPALFSRNKESKSKGTGKRAVDCLARNSSSSEGDTSGQFQLHSAATIQTQSSDSAPAPLLHKFTRLACGPRSQVGGDRQTNGQDSLQSFRLSATTLAKHPSLLYTLLLISCLMCLFACKGSHCLVSESDISKNFNPSVDFRNLATNIVSRLPSFSPRSDRWTRVPNFGTIRDHNRRREGYLSRLLNRIATRIGARNTIRAHNAFRDFAWRVLSSFSMPTPVIYELKRQNFYPPEDDLMNDSLFDKNTTKTIRSRRQLKPWEQRESFEKAASSVRREEIQGRASEDEDELEEEQAR